MAEILKLDGEGAGGTPWEFDSITKDAYGDFALDDTNPQEETYHYRYTSLATEEGHAPARGYGTKGYAAQTEIYFAARLYIPSGFGTIDGGSTIFGLFQFIDISEGGKGQIGIEMNPGGSALQGWLFNDGSSNHRSTKNFTLGAYHILQIHILCGASGQFQAWVDGEHVVTVPKDHTGIELDELRCGQMSSGGPPDTGVTLDFDLILLHDAVIGGYDWPEATISSGGLVKVVSGGIIKPKWFGWPK